MAATNRLFVDFISGVTDVALSAGDTTISGPFLADLPAVADPDFIALILDPEFVGGNPEVVWVTAHTAGATTATIQRGKEGSSARAHDSGIKVVAGLTADAVEELFDVVADAHDAADNALAVANGHAARHALNGADPLPANSVGATQIADGVLHEEVSNHAVQSSAVNPGTSYGTILSVTLNIPSHWKSWECFAAATYVAKGSGDVNDLYDTRLLIDGTVVHTKTQMRIMQSFQDGGIIGRRSGMTTKGNRTVVLQGRESETGIQFDDIFLYARAVRLT